MPRGRLMAAAGIMLVITVLLMRSGEAEKILDHLEELRTLTEVLVPESGIEQLARARQIGMFFSEQTSFDLSNAGYRSYAIPDRHELVRRIARGRARLASLELGMQELGVNIEGDTAQVQVQASALGALTGEPDRFLEIHLFEVTLGKHNGRWLVTGARHLRDERQPTASQPPLAR